MKILYLLFAVLFAAISTALFAQVTNQNSQQEKDSILIHNPKYDFNTEDFSAAELFPQHIGQPTVFWKNSQATDGLVYVCDSAFSYATNVNLGKITYIRDAEDKLLTELRQIWISEYAVWVNYEKFSYTYDASGDTLSEISQNWDTGIGAWVNYGKDSYTYDAPGNTLTYRLY